MAKMEPVTTATPRVDAVVNDVITALTDIIEKHRVTWQEFGAATEWLALAGSQGSPSAPGLFGGRSYGLRGRHR